MHGATTAPTLGVCQCSSHCVQTLLISLRTSSNRTLSSCTPRNLKSVRLQTDRGRTTDQATGINPMLHASVSTNAIFLQIEKICSSGSNFQRLDGTNDATWQSLVSTNAIFLRALLLPAPVASQSLNLCMHASRASPSLGSTLHPESNRPFWDQGNDRCRHMCCPLHCHVACNRSHTILCQYSVQTRPGYPPKGALWKRCVTSQRHKTTKRHTHLQLLLSGLHSSQLLLRSLQQRRHHVIHLHQ